MTDSRLDDLKGHLHDVSNALTIVLGWAEEARRSQADPAFVGHALEMIEGEARRARSLSRRAIGAESESVARDLQAILRELLLSIEIEARRGAVKVEIEGCDSMLVDSPEELFHVVTNLLLNALAHAPRDSRIVVNADVEDGSVRVTVSDEGPGIPEARRTAIFHGDSRRPGGAGVGLPHARAIARGLGGDLWLEPSDTGARFCIEWPVHAIPPPPRSSVAAPPALFGVRILLVEDDAGVVALLNGALTARGAQVTALRTKDEVLRELDDHDVIVVDLSPLGHDMEGVVKHMRACSPRAHFVVTTGSVDSIPDALADALVVRKPFEVAEVVGAIVRGSLPKI